MTCHGYFLPVTSLNIEQNLTCYLSLLQVNPKLLPVADKFFLTLTCDRQGFVWHWPVTDVVLSDIDLWQMRFCLTLTCDRWGFFWHWPVTDEVLSDIDLWQTRFCIYWTSKSRMFSYKSVYLDKQYVFILKLFNVIDCICHSTLFNIALLIT